MKRKLFIILLFFNALIWIMPSSVSAETKEIYISSSGADENNGANETPVKTIKKALQLIDTDEGKIIFKDSAVINYKVEIANGKNITIKSLSDPVTLTWALNEDGENDNDWGLRVINKATLTLENIILDGTGNYPKVALIYVDNSTLNITENTLLRNQKSTWFGGGVRATNSKINMTSGKIENNSAQSGGGAFSLVNSELKISGGEISNNESIAGAGIYAQENSNIELSGNTKITQNKSTGYGGGIFAMDSNLRISDDVLISENIASDKAAGVGVVNGQMIMNGGTIKDNTANNQDGGGIWLENSQATITKALIEGNKTNTGTKSSVSYRGGGIFAYKNSHITIDGDVTIKNNTAVRGGGLYIYDSNLEIKKGNIIENTATANGGGIFIFNTTSEDGKTIIFQAFIDQNKNTGTDVDLTPDYVSDTEFSGGGIYISENAKVTIYNVIIKNNTTNQELFLDNREEDTGLSAGGIAFCPNAKGYIYMTNGAAIYNNLGGYDILLVPQTSKLPGGKASLHLAKQALAGGLYNWKDLNNKPVSTEDQLIEKDILGYTSNLTPDDISHAENEAQVIISNNTTNSLYGAGGIMCNGYLTLGKDELPNMGNEGNTSPNNGDNDKNSIENPQTGEIDFLIVNILLLISISGLILSKKLNRKIN